VSIKSKYKSFKKATKLTGEIIIAVSEEVATVSKKVNVAVKQLERESKKIAIKSKKKLNKTRCKLAKKYIKELNDKETAKELLEEAIADGSTKAQSLLDQYFH